MRGIVGTAGHIDHGKTELVRALTGEHTDRLPEEQKRGISIDLGFTHLETARGRLGVINVPGHEDFIRNMLAGATGIDLLLLVVAADEGVMPQTREHVAIAELLGVHRAVVALTKADLVDDEWLGLVHDDLAGFLAKTPFAGAPVIPTSTADGTGIDEVRSAIEDVFGGTRGDPDDLFRMPVDRTFTVKGTGTVVTGTVWSGRLTDDQTVRVLPGDREARVRGLQVHGGDVAAVEAGERAAVALSGVDRDQVERGMVLVRGAGWTASSMITASVRVLPASQWRLEPWQRVRVHVGTAEVMARAVLLDTRAIEPGQQALVQLRLEQPLVARAGDRLVVRSYSPVTTFGGGVVLEPDAPKRSHLEAGDLDHFAALLDAEPTRRVDALLADAEFAGVEVTTLPIVAGVPPEQVERVLDDGRTVRIAGRGFEATAAETVRQDVLDAVTAHHEEAPLQPGIDPEVLRRGMRAGATDELVEHALEGLVREGLLMRVRGSIANAGFTSTLTAEQAALRDRILDELRNDGLAAPRIDELADRLGSPPELDDLIRSMEADGDVIRVEHDLYLPSAALDQAVARLRERLGGQGSLSPGDFRDVLDLSRKHLIPLLEYLDRIGVTARSADGRTITG